jgi:hypothetical protein
MKTRLLTLSLITLGLAACGSGGHSFPGDNNPNTPNTPPRPTTALRTGSILKIDPNSYRFITAEAAHFSGDNINTITVEGKTIQIVPEGTPVQTIIPIDTGGKRLVNNTLLHTRFGYVHDSNTTNGYMVAQGYGTLARDLPSGTASYEGYAVHADTTDPSNGLVSGSARFDVDFANHKINGTITPNGKSSIALDNGQLAGASFNGRSTSGAIFTGQFNGPNAEELSGTYHKAGEYSGAFGASKTDN